MAARILPFPSLVPPSEKPLLFAAASGQGASLPGPVPVHRMISVSGKVQYYPSVPRAEEASQVRLQVEQELEQGYLEVQLTGITWRRLLAVYGMLLRKAWSRTRLPLMPSIAGR